MKFDAYVLTISGPDCPGIIAQTTGILFKYGANLEDVTMTILEGQFAMMLIVRIKNEATKKKVARSFLGLEKKGLVFYWRKVVLSSQNKKTNNNSYLITAIGRDRTGIVHRISQYLASLKLNITDLNSRLIAQNAGGVYALMLEVDVPSRIRKSKIQLGLKRIARILSIDIQIKAVERLEI